MADWFRSWHGAPTDPKWRSVARRAKVSPGVVAAIAWVLLDRASQAELRGSVAGYDAEDIANALEFERGDVEAVIAAMGDKGVLVDQRFAAWDKRQPKREDESVERVRKHREVQRQLEMKLLPAPALSLVPPPDETPCNAVKRTVTTESEESRSDQSVGQFEHVPREATDRPTDDFLISKLTAAIGDKAAPGLVTASGIRPIRDLIDEGCDLELDVLPEVREVAKHLSSPWRKFSRTLILDRIRDRQRLRVANETRARGRPAQVFVEFDSPQWHAWQLHEGRTRPAHACAVGGRRRKGWYFPSEWPPAAKKQAGG